MSRSSVFPFHVLFLAAFSPLILLVNNLEQAEIWVATRPLAYSIVVALILLLLFRVVAKDWGRSGLFVAWILVLFFTYGHVYEVTKGIRLFGFLIGRHRYLMVLWLLLLVLGAFLINRRVKRIAEITRVLNVVSLFLLLAQMVQITVYGIQRRISYRQAEAAAQPTLLNIDEDDEMPDVYLIILDMYGREDALLAHYNYDNHEFVTQLENLGFYVAKCGRSNYSKTVLSLPSQLNMDYVDNLIEDPGTLPRQDSQPHRGMILYFGPVVGNHHGRQDLEPGDGPGDRIVRVDEAVSLFHQLRPEVNDSPEIIPAAFSAIDEQDIHLNSRPPQTFYLTLNEGAEGRFVGGRIHIGDNEYFHGIPKNIQGRNK